MSLQEWTRVLLSSAMGALGFGWLVHAPKKTWFASAVLAACTFGLYRLLFSANLSDSAALFLASAAGSFAALLLARKLRTIGTTFLMLSIVSFVPGLGLYRCMQFLGAGDTGMGAEFGVAAMVTIAMIALGQAAGSLLFRLFHRQNRHDGTEWAEFTPKSAR